jgi:protein TonB
MRKRKTTAIWKYILIAVVLHSAVILMPGRLVEVLFPRSAPENAGPPSDLTPNFEQYAIHVVYIDDEEPQVEILIDPTVEVAPLEPEPEYLERITEAEAPQAAEEPQADPDAPHGAAGPPPTGEGEETGEAPGAGGDEGILVAPETRYYPPVPRLIVPPSVENLDLEDLTVTLRILVDKWGRPVEVIIVNAPEDRLVHDRIMEAARQFRFRPARRGDSPVEAWIELPLNLETTRRD